MKFSTYHPVILFLYFVVVIGTTIYFFHPIYLGISLISSFFVSLKYKKYRPPIALYILCFFWIVFYVVWYAAYHHFGITVFGETFIGNAITGEAIATGAAYGCMTASIVLWLFSFHSVMDTDKLVFLFGRVTPRGALFLAILFRMIPRMKKRGKDISTAQGMIGKGIRGERMFRKIIHSCRMVSILITWTLDHFMETASSMRCRGFGSGKPTAFKRYSLEQRDRILLILMTLMVAILLDASILNQTKALFNPEIIIPRISALGLVSYVSYFLFCMFPYWMDIWKNM